MIILSTKRIEAKHAKMVGKVLALQKDVEANKLKRLDIPVDIQPLF